LLPRLGEGKTAKNRLHLDVRAATGLHGDERMAVLEAECERLVGLGATRLRRDEPAPPISAGYLVMADPEGNEFCLDCTTGNFTPVRSSETAHSRCWTATSYDSGLEVTSRGWPMISLRPPGP
jgi:Glyoxalase-like domain